MNRMYPWTLRQSPRRLQCLCVDIRTIFPAGPGHPTSWSQVRQSVHSLAYWNAYLVRVRELEHEKLTPIPKWITEMEMSKTRQPVLIVDSDFVPTSPALSNSNLALIYEDDPSKGVEQGCFSPDWWVASPGAAYKAYDTMLAVICDGWVCWALSLSDIVWSMYEPSDYSPAFRTFRDTYVILLSCGWSWLNVRDKTFQIDRLFRFAQYLFSRWTMDSYG